jgi:DNA polymerase II large subunit
VVEGEPIKQEVNVSNLKDKTWLELCQAASREHDPEKLLELITALNDLLERMEMEEKARHACGIVWDRYEPSPNIAAA